MAPIQTDSSYLTEAAKQLRISPTLEINELVGRRLAQGRSVVHLGFGEATFPVQKDVLAAHRAASESTSYLPVAGLQILREVSFDTSILYCLIPDLASESQSLDFRRIEQVCISQQSR